MNQVVLIILSLLVLLLIGAVFLFFYIGTLRTEALSSWTDVLERLNLRLDKIPNLIETLRRLERAEQKLFASLIELRERTWPLDKPDRERVHAELAVVGKLHECWQLPEKFEELRKDTAWLGLRTEFNDVGREIEEYTNKYNDKARHYNQSREFILFRPFTLAMGFRRLPILEFE